MLQRFTDPNENILWQGKPHRFLYVLGNPLIYPFALCWGLFDLFFIGRFNAASHGLFPYANFFILFHLAPVWYAIFSPVYRFFNWYRIDYALTDKRLYFTSRLIGLDIASAELPEVQNLRCMWGRVGSHVQTGHDPLRWQECPALCGKSLRSVQADSANRCRHHHRPPVPQPIAP